jgi:hypothetical protein
MLDTYDVTTWRIRFTYWISKATCTYAHAHAYAPGYPHARTHTLISNIYCFSAATVIHECASVLCYTYIYSEIRTKPLRTLRGQNVEFFLNLKPGVMYM